MPKDVIIGAPVDKYTSVEGSQRYPCAECGTDVWIAPSGQRMIEEADLAVLCMTCGLAAIEADPAPEIRPTTQDQAREIFRGIMREETRRRRN